MSLLTPPRSSHKSDKEKENKFSSAPLAGPSTRSVVWAPQNSIHNLSTPIKHVLFSSKNRPGKTKSILKPSNQPILISSEPASSARETTPEPADPLVDLNYLNRPVSQILAEECNTEDGIRQRVEGYTDLATRLRASVDSKTCIDASWPLFQPLRKNQQAFVDVLVRDVGRALLDPLSCSSEVEEEKRPRFSLPSPEKSPTKKKGGFSEEQIKLARDLCTICHAALKLLSVLLAFPALYNVFDHKQLQELLTAVLAIPLADDLPTPNARKTCALVIWLIQVQRLPEEVLSPAALRISYALRRGMDGELGKEGKKGSANDGLKAIHDLCEYLPSVFVPAFTPLLPSVLSNLLAPTLVLRTQACHALGGFAFGSTQIPLSTIHTKISRTIADYVTTPTASPSKAPAAASPSKVTVTEAAIIRTLRTTMKNTEPVQVAQGPVWAVSVIASFVVLLGARICEDAKIARIVSGLMSLGLQHGKSSMRALVCIVWRPIAWAYLQPALPVEEKDSDGEEEADAEGEEDEEKREMVANARARYLKVIMSVVDCQAGVSSIAALLSDDAVAGDETALKACIEILQSMVLKATTQSCQDAVETLRHMVNPQENADDVPAWSQKLLLPKKLFSASPGLLTADFKCLNSAVRPVLEEVALINDVRCFTREEMAKPWVFRGVVVTWRAALGYMELADDAELPEAMVEIWQHLLRNIIELHQENEDEEALAALACTSAKYIVHVLEDPNLNLMPNKDSEQDHLLSAVDAMFGSDDTVLDAPNNDASRTGNVCSDSELRLRVVHTLWSVMRQEFPAEALRGTADQILLAALMKNEAVLVYERTRTTSGVPFDDSRQSARERNAWLALVVDVLVAAGDAERVKAFWECDDSSMMLSPGRHTGCWSKGYTRAVWRTCVQKWTELGGGWEGGVVLLGVPFTDKHYWSPTSEDFALWEEFLSYTTGKALDDSVNDSSVVLDSISSFVSSFQTPDTNPSASLRLLDLLLTALDAADMRDLPTGILELASQTLSATYPPELKNKQPAVWMLRSLTSVVEKCPAMFAQQLLERVQEGLCGWLADECEVWTEELTYDIVPLYTHILLKIQGMPLSIDTLNAMGDLMVSIFRRRTPSAAVEAFRDFWSLTYATLETPAEGWSDSIRRCLVAVGILPYEEPEVIKNPESPLASALVLQPSSPHTPTSSAPSCPSPSLFGSEFLDRVQSPKRPSRAFGGSYPTVLSTPPSPVQVRRTKANAQRTPLSPRNLSPPPKRRRLLSLENGEDKTGKENDVSAPPVTILDRIAQMKSAKSNGKKRRFDEDDEEYKDEKEVVVAPSAKKLRSRMKARPIPASKPRAVSPPRTVTYVSSDESDDERLVEESLTNSIDFPSTNEEGEEAMTPRRTRSSLRADSSRPIASGSGLSTPMKKIDLSTVKMRRSVSNPEARFIESVAQENSRKLKRKNRESDDDHFDKLSSSDTPLPAPFVPASRPLRRVFSLPPSSVDVPLPSASSDDDPHTGQVTPHRLISPVPKRRVMFVAVPPRLKSTKTPTLDEELFGDEVPSSDDSVSIASGSESESPIKAVVSRHLRRLRSSDTILPSKPVRKSTVIDVLDLTV